MTRYFLSKKLIADLILTRGPVLVGEGIPVFGRLPADLPLRHETTRTFLSGVVQSHYALHLAP